MSLSKAIHYLSSTKTFILIMATKFVGATGLEPVIAEPKSTVLPLHYTPLFTYTLSLF